MTFKLKTMANLGSTNDLMRVLNVGSHNTINKLQEKGIIKPIMVGRVRKWDLDQCLKSVINYTNEKAKA